MQSITVDGSSFESASSFHSLARVDAICEDVPIIEDKPKSSPSHSVSSSTSSDSYCMPHLKPPSPRNSLQKPIQNVSKNNKKITISEEEKSVKVITTSERVTMRSRRSRDWSEDERRRKKGNFKLDIEKDGTKISFTSPLTNTSMTVKKSPDERSSVNIIEGSSPSKHHKRFRAKTRKTPRNRTPISVDESKQSRPKPPAIKSPEKASTTLLHPFHQGSDHTKSCILSTSSNIHKKSTTVQRLKAISTESLRSVSPGSDSVFYSEADILEHQIHCHHCGKEVEVVTATADGSEGSVIIVDDGPDIVQPPELFADSPNGIMKTSPLLKYSKRFRTEDRRIKKGHNGRAKV